MSAIEKIQMIRRLAGELRWGKSHAELSARIVVSKAFWLGLERGDLERHLVNISYLQQHAQILDRAWEEALLATLPESQRNSLEFLLEHI